MSSTRKTLDLLSFFSAARPEIGLSELHRLAKRDKATTHRHLQTLEHIGFVEQNNATKKYRLGPALLALARTREVTVPRKAGAIEPLSQLALAVGETTHASILSGTSLFSLAACESSQHSTRVVIDLDRFPLHATASGHCVLAFGPAELIDVAHENIETFTDHTIASAHSLAQTLDVVRSTGFGRSLRSFEQEVSSLAVPVFDETGQCAGAVSVACVATRFSPALERTCQEHLILASRAITKNWGGVVSDDIEALWASALSTSTILDTAS